MIVYLDSSNIFDAMKDKLDLEPLSRRGDIQLVFSLAHFDDAGGGGSRGFAELANYIHLWPSALFSAAPHRIPALEFLEFLKALPDLPADTPRVIFDSPDSLGSALDALDGPPQIEIKDADDLDDQLGENEEMKRLLAKAMTHSKRAAAMRSTVLPKEVDLEAAAAALIEQTAALDDESREAIARFVESGQAVEFPESYPESTQALQREMMAGLVAQQAAALTGDVILLAEILDRQRALMPRIEADPLLGPAITSKRAESERWTSFHANCVAMAGDIGKIEPLTLRAVYENMLAHPELCPAWTLLTKIEARMKRDAQTPAKASDRVDLNHLNVLPYVDVLFVDSRIETYLRQSPNIEPTMKAKCLRSSDVEKWLNQLSPPRIDGMR